MSDTGAASPPELARPRSRGCCLKLALGLLLIALVAGGYVAWAFSVALEPQPLPFEPFSWGPLERTLLSGKMELRELPGRLLGGPTELTLDERELNGLLFGDAGHTAERKARVLLQGDHLGLEVSAPSDRPGKFINFVATLRVSITPAGSSLELLDGRLGGYQLGPISRPLVARSLAEGLARLRARNPDLGRLDAFWVEDGAARLICTHR